MPFQVREQAYEHGKGLQPHRHVEGFTERRWAYDVLTNEAVVQKSTGMREKSQFRRAFSRGGDFLQNLERPSPRRPVKGELAKKRRAQRCGQRKNPGCLLDLGASGPDRPALFVCAKAEGQILQNKNEIVWLFLIR